jgi:hypothetical protein
MAAVALEGHGRVSSAGRGGVTVARALAGKGTAATYGLLRNPVQFRGSGHASSAGKMRVPSRLPSSMRALHFADGEFPDGTSTLLEPLTISFEDKLLDIGAGTVTLRADDSAADTIAPEDVIAIDLINGYNEPIRAAVMVVDEDDLIAIDSNEEAGQTVTYSGPLLLGLLKDGLIEPPGGTGSFPVVEDMVFDWNHIEYDDSDTAVWPVATVITSVDDAKDGGANEWQGVPWSDDMPGDSGAVKIIGPSAGTISSAPEGIWYWRDDNPFTGLVAPYDGIYYLYATCDNTAVISIDGAPVATIGGVGNLLASGFTGSVSAQPIYLSTGFHVISGEVTNYPSVLSNPTGLAALITTPTYVIDSSSIIWMTDGTELVNEYPAETPGMTPGNAFRLWLESQQDLGRFTEWTLDFDDDEDSARVAWDVSPTISVRVGQDDGLSLMLKIMEAYADVRIDVNDYVVRMYNKDAYSPTSGVEFEVGNLTALRFHRTRLTGDELLVKSQLGWTRGGSGGRREAYLSLGAENNADEVSRLATAALSVSSDPPEEVALAYVARDDSEIPYVNTSFVVHRRNGWCGSNVRGAMTNDSTSGFPPQV